MSWGRLDDGFYDHPKVEDLSLAAIGLWTLCLSRALRHHRTDPIKGYVPEARVKKLAGSKAKQLSNELVRPPAGRKHGLWEPIEGGWLIHDFEVYLKPGRDPEEASEAGRRGAAARWAKEGGQLSDSHSSSHGSDADSHSSDNGSANGSGIANDASRRSPVPSRPVPKEQESPSDSWSTAKFDEFWAAYPKHVAKQAARRRWDTLVKAGADPDRIIAGARAYALEVSGTEARFVKQPDGWLLAGRWEDEPAHTPSDATPPPWDA